MTRSGAGEDPSRDAVVSFNDAVNRRDLAALGALMTDDHTFVDSGGEVFAGKARVLAAWDGFFAAFPDYRNEWSDVSTIAGSVVAVGRSTCTTEPALEGPAIWVARTEGGRAAEWHVYEDTSASRNEVGLSAAGK